MPYFWKDGKARIGIRSWGCARQCALTLLKELSAPAAPSSSKKSRSNPDSLSGIYVSGACSSENVDSAIAFARMPGLASHLDWSHLTGLLIIYKPAGYDFVS